MKVKVTYTIDYDDVPRIVNELLNKCRTQLTRSAEFKFDLFRLDEATAEVIEIQKTMDLVSSQLEDCINLCRGYVEAANAAEDAVKLPETEEMERLTAQLTETTAEMAENE